GQGGFLAPTHIHHYNLVTPSDSTENSTDNYSYKRSTSSSDDSFQIELALNQEQTSSHQDNHDDTQWNNTYWLTSNQVDNTRTKDTTINSAPSVLSKIVQKIHITPKEDSTSLLQNAKPEALVDSNEISWSNSEWEASVIEIPTSTKHKTQSTTPSIKSWKHDASRTPTVEKQQDKTWVNPYWKDYKPQIATPSKQKHKPWINPYWKDYKPQTVAPSKQQDTSWVNPYWKDYKPQPVTSSKQQEKPWVNPYWKDHKPQIIAPSKQQKDKPWINPYWKDYKPHTATSSKHRQDKPWVNPYWKDYKPHTVTPSKQQDKPW
ncbi:unnamed protein product, partial [Rotaria sordida]